MSGTYEERHGTEPTGDTGCEGLVPDPDLITAQDVASARHCEIRVDGLPPGIRPGNHAVTFSGMEYLAGSNRPVIRFRYAGELNDDATVKQYPPQLTEDELTRIEAEMDRTREAAREILKEGEAGIPERTHFLTPAEVQAENAAQAEAEGWLPTRDEHSPPQPPQQVPDLYQVSTVETINVSKLARVIAVMTSNGVLIEGDLDELGLTVRSTPREIEDWLRS